MKGRDGSVILAYQPYDHMEKVSRMGKKWANERNLDIAVYDPSKSWHYPGATCLVVISLRDAKTISIPKNNII